MPNVSGSRRLLVGAVAGVAFLLASAPAWADVKGVSDGNDVPGPLDIKRVAHGHAGASVTHTLTTFQPFSSSLLRDPYGITFQFDTNGSPASFERFVFVFWGNGRLRAALTTRTRFVASVRVSRPNARAVRITVRKALLNAGGYRWLAATFFPGGRGFDVAPNRSVVFHDLTAPAITQLGFPDPSTNASATLTFPVGFTLADPSGIRSWQLQRRLAGTAAWTTVAQGAGTGAKNPQVTGVEGETYEFRIRATDRAGNTRTSGIRVVSVPFDDANALFGTAYTGNVTVGAGGDSFLDSLHLLLPADMANPVAGTFTHTFAGTSVAVIASTGGTATVTIDGGPPELLDTSAAGPRTKVFERTGLTPGPHTIVIVAQPGAAVSLDGFVFR
ncbi:MAG TPA: hypothetical protein VD769_00305 [Gaiellaceae bacterium]|nr:hypothetical protein [Gaiellaceae bacterium]